MTLTVAQFIGILSPLVAMFVGLVGLAIKVLGTARKQENRMATVEGRSEEDYKDIEKLQDKVDGVRSDLDRMLGAWEEMKPMLIDVLHKPHPAAAATDALLDAYKADKLEGKRREKLKTKLREIIDDKSQPGDDRLAAIFLLTTMLMEDRNG